MPPLTLPESHASYNSPEPPVDLKFMLASILAPDPLITKGALSVVPEAVVDIINILGLVIALAESITTLLFVVRVLLTCVGTDKVSEAPLLMLVCAALGANKFEVTLVVAIVVVQLVVVRDGSVLIIDRECLE